MAAHFSPETLSFLRGLKRHNDRTWFEERRPVYLRALRDPLHATIDAVNDRLAAFAPEHLRPAHKVAMRIYRDTRFSPDKRPYKHHLSAWWARTGLEKTSAAGFFFQLSPEAVTLAAGVYEPEREDMLRVRRWLAEHHPRYRDELAALLQAKRGRVALQPLDGHVLTRNPKGFAPDHPASDLLRARNWGVVTTLPVELAFQPDLPETIAGFFGRAAALVALLNEPFLAAGSAQGPRHLDLL